LELHRKVETVEVQAAHNIYQVVVEVQEGLGQVQLHLVAEMAVLVFSLLFLELQHTTQAVEVEVGKRVPSVVFRVVLVVLEAAAMQEVEMVEQELLVLLTQAVAAVQELHRMLMVLEALVVLES
jgi:hypothetical protein